MMTGLFSYGQQDAQFSQYMYNTININPAYAGSRDAFSLFALHRSQWVGIDGAPITNILSINSPISATNLGIGISVINDKIGPTNENDLAIDVSYTFNTSEKYKLSFGLKGTINLFNLDISQLNPLDQNDPQFQNINATFTPNFGVGLYFHSDKSYFGISVPKFIESKHYDDNSVAIFKEKTNYYFIAGSVFDVNTNLKIKPSILTKAVSGAPLQLDLSGNFLFYNKFVLGGAYRWGAAVSGLMGYQISEGLFLGYGYDYETTNLSNYNSGSHEVFLRYEIIRKDKKIISPRFF
jgi:type IX secretion system PorP/SprF family membrane protein